MKRTGMIRTLLFIAYGVPYAFLSVYGDAVSGTMLFYGGMIAGFTLLCWGALRTKNIAWIYIGNALSLVSSCIAAKLSGLEPMRYYFKPFTSYGLIVAISIFAVIIQTIVILVYSARKRGTEN